MAAPGVPSGPTALRPAPAHRATPLPGSFSVVRDPATSAHDDGRVLLGGSPLRLVRISPRAATVVQAWGEGAPVGPGRVEQLLARRLVSTGAFHPHPPRGASAVHSVSDITVVIPVRDRPAQLDRLLGALGDVRCVVVDDASTDPSLSRAITERHGARFIGLTRNAGPSGARNAGFAAASSPLVAFIDSDCVPVPGWMEPLVGHFDDPVVGAVAPRVLNAPPERRGPLARYQDVRSSLDMGRAEALVQPGSRVSYVPSAALVLRREVADGPRLFDPGLRGGEDVDLVWRLAGAGWQVRYEPDGEVLHDALPTVGTFLARRAFYGSTAADLSVRHGAAVAPAAFSGWSLAVWALALARRPAAALGAQAVSVAILRRRMHGLVRRPAALATRIAAGGTAGAALPALAGLVRTWSPALVVGLAVRPTRRASAVALLVPALHDWWSCRHALDPVRFSALHVADDVAYGAGVWAGCVRARTGAPLVPRISWRARAWSARGLDGALSRHEAGSGADRTG